MVVSEEMFENVDKQTGGKKAGVICILLAHLGTFSFVELKTLYYSTMICDLHFDGPGAY